VTAEKVIEEIQNLPRAEQSRVVQFAFELARGRQLSGAEITMLAEEMVNTSDPTVKARLRAELTRGFYGD
jgi:isocitrate/isopropylmalate dehydrogenase